VEAFETFDEHGLGYLSDEQFVELLTEWGEPMSIDEARESLSEEGIIEGHKVYYRRYAEFLVHR